AFARPVLPRNAPRLRVKPALVPFGAIGLFSAVLPKLIRRYARAIERCTQTAHDGSSGIATDTGMCPQRSFGMRKTMIVVATAVLAVGGTSLSTSASAFGLLPLGGLGLVPPGGLGLIHPGLGLPHPGGGFGLPHPGGGFGLPHPGGGYGLGRL